MVNRGFFLHQLNHQVSDVCKSLARDAAKAHESLDITLQKSAPCN